MSVDAYRLFFKAVSNPARYQIIALLRKSGKLSVNQIVEKTGLEQSWVSHSLKCLTDCGFTDATQNGKKRLYALDHATIQPLLDLMDKHLKKYESRLRQCGMLEGEK